MLREREREREKERESGLFVAAVYKESSTREVVLAY
jgi:hypothetical protein